MQTTLSPLLLIVLLYDACSLSSCNHPTSAATKRDLVEVFGQRIALSQIYASPIGGSQPALRLRFFDGRQETRSISCCSRPMSATVSQNRLVFVDTDLQTTKGLGEMISKTTEGGQVVSLDLDGKIVARSKVSISSNLVALSPDGKRFAFGGVPGGFPQQDSGVYIGTFESSECRRIFSIGYRPIDRDRTGLNRESSLQWASDGRRVLFSYRGKVVLIDADTGKTQSLIDGGGARLSPDGNRLAYITPGLSSALLDLTTGKSHVVDPDQKTNMQPVEWSPDGRYIAFVEAEGSHVPYGCLWVYRVSDGSFVAIPGWGIGPAVHWVSLGDL